MTTAFEYEAYLPDGRRRRKGIIQADSVAEATEVLRSRRGLVPIRVRARNAWSMSVVRERMRGSKIRASDLSWMARALATSVGIGIPMDRAIDALARQRSGTGIGRVLESLQESIAQGKSHANAFAEHTDQLGDLFTVMVAQGDESGKLDQTLAKLADILEARARVFQAVKSALVYPIMVLAIVILLTTAMMLIVVPIFKKLYYSITAHASLPGPTQVTVFISDLLIYHWYIFIPLLAIAGYVIYRAVKSDSFRQKTDRFMLHAPVFGSMMQDAASARMAYTLGSLMDAGMVSQRALTYTGDVAGNYALKNAMYEASGQMERGTTMTAALALHDDVIPEMFMLCVQQGEETAHMPELLERFGKQSEEAAATKAKNMSQLLEPIMTVVLGALVGSIVISLYLPMFDIYKLLQKQGG